MYYYCFCANKVFDRQQDGILPINCRACDFRLGHVSCKQLMLQRIASEQPQIQLEFDFGGNDD